MAPACCARCERPLDCAQPLASASALPVKPACSRSARRRVPPCWLSHSWSDFTLVSSRRCRDYAVLPPKEAGALDLSFADLLGRVVGSLPCSAQGPAGEQQSVVQRIGGTERVVQDCLVVIVHRLFSSLMFAVSLPRRGVRLCPRRGPRPGSPAVSCAGGRLRLPATAGVSGRTGASSRTWSCAG